MTVFFRPLFLLSAFCILICAPLAVQAQETDRYGQWHSSDDQLQGMINELDRIIDEGSKARAAHPGFLQDLQEIVDRYRTPRKTVFFSDDFSDYDFNIFFKGVILAS